MKREFDKSKASFKLDLIETANADPMVKPADLKVLAAYIAVMDWPSGKAWLAASLGTSMTGLSHGQFWISRSRLSGDNEAGRKYLIEVRSDEEVSTYRIVNPWRGEAIDLVEARLANRREADRQRKAASRKRRSVQKMEGQEPDVSLQNLEGQKPSRPSRIRKSVPPDSGGNSPSVLPQEKENGRGDDPGSNVVPFNRRAS